jgi:hypothetical protein
MISFWISVVPPKIEQKRNQVLSRRQGPARPGHLGQPGPNNWVLSRDGELAWAALPYQAELSLIGACAPDQKVRPVAKMSPARLLRRHPRTRPGRWPGRAGRRGRGPVCLLHSLSRTRIITCHPGPRTTLLGAGLALSGLWLETVALVADLPEAYRGYGHAEQDPQARQ